MTGYANHEVCAALSGLEGNRFAAETRGDFTAYSQTISSILLASINISDLAWLCHETCI